MESTVIKHSLITIFKGIVILLAVLFALRLFGCGKEVVITKTDNSELFAKMKSDSVKLIAYEDKRVKDSLNTLASKHSEDSIKVVADKFNSLYKSSSKRVRELLARGICDTTIIQIAVNDCDSTIKSKDSLLAQKDSTNKSVNKELSTVKEELVISKGMVATAQTVVKNQASDYKLLEDESKKVVKKERNKTKLAIIVASVIEVLTIFALK